MLAAMFMRVKRGVEKRSASRQIDTSLHATGNCGRVSLLRASVLLAGVCLVASTVSAQSFRIVTFAAPGEYVSGGSPRLFVSPANQAFPSVLDRSAPAGTDYFTYAAGYSNGDFFAITLATDALNSNLQSGVYVNAQRAPFATPGHPGLDVVMLGNGCNTLSGSFVIHSVSLSPTQDVDAIDASFTQYCEGQEPPLVGRFTYRAAGGTIAELAPYELAQPKVVSTLHGISISLLVATLLLTALVYVRRETYRA